MKKRKMFFFCALCVSLLTVEVPQNVCAQKQEVKQEKTKENKETVEKVKCKLSVGQTMQLSFECGRPDKNPPDTNPPYEKPEEEVQEIKWKSSDTSIATVTQTGVVTAKKAGKVKITRYVDGKKAIVYELKVFQPVTKIKLRGPSSMKIGTSKNVKATVCPSNAGNKSLKWKSSNKKVATVSSSGQVYAKKKGNVKITCEATDGSRKKASIKIRMK